VDRYGRLLTHMRITVTLRCNYKCIFCHREGELSSPDKLSVEDILTVAKAAYSLGIKYFKLTGGEPLIRKDILDIIEGLSKLPDVEVSMVTNGYYLYEYADKLRVAGLSRLNVSLHSINSVTYEKITGVNGLSKVIRGIDEALKNGLKLKLNVLALKGLNEQEIVKILDFASQRKVDVNLIELIPIGISPEDYSKLYLNLSYIERYLREISIESYKRRFQNRPVYVMPSGIRVELIRSLGNREFCANCMRIRLTHDGKLKPCLMRNDNLLDISKILDRRAEESWKIEKIKQAIIKANESREPYFK